MTTVDLPFWPMLLTRQQLTAYLGGISESTLIRVCPVSPVDLGANVTRYRRPEIDAWLATLPPRDLRRRQDDEQDSPPPAEAFVPINRAADAIDRARARAGGKRGADQVRSAG